MYTRNLRVEEAWGIVAVGFFLSLFSSGVRFAFGPFLEPLMLEFGYTRTELSLVVAASMLLYGLAMPLTGRLADVFGSRPVLVAGALVLAGSLLIVATTRSGAVFAVAFALVASFGFAAMSQVVISPVISSWFRRKRGLAMTFLSAGGMGGIAVWTPLSAILVMAIGWRATYLVQAAALVVLMLPAILLFVPGKRANAPAVAQASAQAAAPSGDAAGQATVQAAGQAAPLPPWQEALRTRPFWQYSLAFVSCGLSMNLLGTHGMPMLVDRGFDPVVSSFAIGAIGLVSIFGSVALGAVSDRIGRNLVLTLIYGVRAFGMVALLWIGSVWGLYLLAAIAGLVWAGSSALTSALTADIYGVHRAGTLFGLAYVGHQIGSAFGSYLGGWSYDRLGGYEFAFIFSAVALLAGALLTVRVQYRKPQFAAQPETAAKPA